MAHLAEDLAPVRAAIRVKGDEARAFSVFTDRFDSWWPRSYNTSMSPLKRVTVDREVGGGVVSVSDDGAETLWGRVTCWDPPRRFSYAWMVNGYWQVDPDVSHASDVDVRFIEEPDGWTRVELVHENFARHGVSAATLRQGVAALTGWPALLEAYAARVSERQ